jgi:hypothetical protein
VTNQTLWAHFKAAVPTAPLNQVFQLAKPSLDLFSQLMILSVSSRLKSLTPSQNFEEEKDVHAQAPDDSLFAELHSHPLDSGLKRLRNQFAQEGRAITSVRQHVALESLRH